MNEAGHEVYLRVTRYEVSVFPDEMLAGPSSVPGAPDAGGTSRG